MEDMSPPHAMSIALPPVQQSGWQVPDFRPQYAEDRRPLNSFLPAFQSTFAHYTPSASTSTSSPSGPPPRHTDITTWRAYTPATSSWQPASSSSTNTANNSSTYDRFSNRRSSIPNFKFAPSMSLSSTKEEAVPEERPRLRKAASSLCIQTTDHHTNHGETGFRSSPYPTPTISPSYNSYFPSSSGSTASGAVEALPYTPYIPPSQQQQPYYQHYQQQEPQQLPQLSHPHAQHASAHPPALPSPTSSEPGHPHSPPHGSYVPLGLDPRQLVHPVSPRTGGGVNAYYQHPQQPAPEQHFFNDNPPPMAPHGGGWSQMQAASTY